MVNDAATIECDVLVAGAGAAGIAAAVAAARAGASVVVLEKYGFPGGLATTAQVGTICGLYLRDKSEALPVRSANGFSKEFSEVLAASSKSKPGRTDNGLYVLPYETNAFIETSISFIAKEPNITLGLHSTITNVRTNERKISDIEALAWNQLINFKPVSVIDATGDATLLHLAGATLTEDRQAAAVTFSMKKTEMMTSSREMQISVIRNVTRAVQKQELSEDCANISFVDGPENTKDVTFKVNLPLATINQWNKMTELEIRSRTVIKALNSFLCNNNGPFKGSYLTSIPIQTGTRGGRLSLGEYILTEDDILNCRRFSDAIARGSWPIEQWGVNPNPKMSYFPENSYYEIPAGSLISKEFENIFTGGRCMSATEKAITSARVIGTSLQTGWAAGTLAAFKAKNRPESEAIELITREMIGDH